MKGSEKIVECLNLRLVEELKNQEDIFDGCRFPLKTW